MIVDNSNIVEKLEKELVQLEHKYPMVKYARGARVGKRMTFDQDFVWQNYYEIR